MDDPITSSPAGDPASTLDLGAWIGRGQAFSFVANHCSAAQAECLARIRKEGLYKSLNITWDEFCTRHAGASRVHTDQIIRRLEEFGAAYFRLSEIIRISPQSYRGIQGSMKGEVLEFAGESIPITPENAPRIRRAVSALRADLRKAQDAQNRFGVGITHLMARLDACFQEMSVLSDRPMDLGERTALQGLARYSMGKLRKLLQKLSTDNP